MYFTSVSQNKSFHDKLKSRGAITVPNKVIFSIKYLPNS